MNSEKTEVLSVSRKAGSLRSIETAAGRRYLVLKGPGTERFLVSGSVLDRDDLELLEGPLARAAGLSLALRLLSRRERTEKEIREALLVEGIDNPEAIDYIVGTLKGKNLLDDRRFASELIEYRMRHRPAGPALFKRKLAEAGVASGTAEELIADAFPPGEEERIARRLAAERLRGSISGAGPRAEREKAARRISGFLSRRGFSSEVVGAVCAGVLRGDISGEQDER